MRTENGAEDAPGECVDNMRFRTSPYFDLRHLEIRGAILRPTLEAIEAEVKLFSDSPPDRPGAQIIPSDVDGGQEKSFPNRRALMCSGRRRNL